MMDPFNSNTQNVSQTGGDLYFNLGNVSEDVLKDGDIVFFDLLLNLEDVQVCRELIDFTSADRVNKTSFSNTVATNETVLAAFYKLYACIIQ